MKTVIFTLILLTGVSTVWPADFSICTGSNTQKHPDIVFDGTRYTVVYDSVGEIWAAKVTTGGSIQNVINLTMDVSQPDSNPCIAFDGTNCFVVWNKSMEVYGAIITQNNIVVAGPFYIPLINGRGHPYISYVNNFYLITGTAQVHGFDYHQGIIEGIIYNTLGGIAVQHFTIDATGSYSNDDAGIFHSVQTTGSGQYLVAYSSWYYHDFYPFEITYALYTKRITTTGQVQPGPTLESISLPYSGGPYRYDTLFNYPVDLTYNPDNPEYFCAYHWPEDNTSGPCNVYGRRISTSGSLIGNRVSIAAVTGRNECAPAIAYECGHYFTTWQDNRNTTYDLFGYFLDQSAVLLGNEITITSASGNQINTQVAFDGWNNLAVWQDYRNSQWDIYGTFYPKAPSSNEAQALAYNGNRHFVRKPTANEFHLVYTDQGKIVYRYSYNGFDWPIQTVLGDGKWPAVAVDANNRAHVSWTDNAGGLWFRYQTGVNTWGSTYHLYTPGSNPVVNSPPAIALVSNRGVIYPHILVTRTGQGGGNVNHSVDDYTFPVTNPGSGSFEQLEYRSALASPSLRLNPTICKDDNDSLHAVWQRTDTIAYATRYRVSSWVVWGAMMDYEGRESAQPYAEAYGNKIFIIWQKKMPGTGIEDVWWGERPFYTGTFTRTNISLTTSTKSLYPTIANGFFKVYADELNAPWDIYYKINPTDDPVNISQTLTTSQYGQTAAKFDSPTARYIYTAWQENNAAPYLIKTKKIQHQDPTFLAYLTSPNGQSQVSPYNVSRDAYNGTGTVPVDIGYSSLSYRFRLLPGFFYLLKTTAYQNQSGIWKETIKLDNGNPLLIQYAAHTPQLIEVWIPPALYEDTVVDLTIGKVSGSYAALGPIEIYQYELDPYQGGGPQTINHNPINSGFITVNPNPFTKATAITLTTAGYNPTKITIYDASGRLVKTLINGSPIDNRSIRWTGDDDNGKLMPKGIYFIHIENILTGVDAVQKVIKVE